LGKYKSITLYETSIFLSLGVSSDSYTSFKTFLLQTLEQYQVCETAWQEEVYNTTQNTSLCYGVHKAFQKLACCNSALLFVNHISNTSKKAACE